jgi:signal transduction histidine kinase
VKDTGPDIPAEYRQAVLQRFCRLDRSRTTPGSGLGLSLVSAVASLHDASLVFEDNEPGLRCVLMYPAQPQNDLDAASFAFDDLFAGKPDCSSPRKVGAPAWFDRRGADRY